VSRLAWQPPLARLPCVRLVDVDVPDRTVRVEDDASDLSIRAAIDEAGYEDAVAGS